MSMHTMEPEAAAQNQVRSCSRLFVFVFVSVAVSVSVSLACSLVCCKSPKTNKTNPLLAYELKRAKTNRQNKCDCKVHSLTYTNALACVARNSTAPTRPFRASSPASDFASGRVAALARSHPSVWAYSGRKLARGVAAFEARTQSGRRAMRRRYSWANFSSCRSRSRRPAAAPNCTLHSAPLQVTNVAASGRHQQFRFR